MIATRAQDIKKYIEEHGFPVEINKPGQRRSERQNKLYWQWMTVIGNHVGHTKNEIHEIMSMEFAPDKEVMGHSIAVGTSEMTPTQMTYYMSQIKRWAYDTLALILPEPDLR